VEAQRQAPLAVRRPDGRAVAGAVLVLLVLVMAAMAARRASWTAGAPAGSAGHTPPAARPTSAGTGVITPPASPAPRRPSPPLPTLHVPDAVLVGALVVLGVALLAWAVRYAPWHRWRLGRPVRPERPVAAEPEAPDRRPLAEAAGRALADLEQPDAREAVIRSWLLLGEAAAEAGVRLRPAETATEHAARIAAEFYVPVPMLIRLAELYREARFSTHVVSGSQRAEARDLLERLSTDLQHGRR
jgi:hypothetical protein